MSNYGPIGAIKYFTEGAEVVEKAVEQVVEQAPVLPVCQTADTLCQLNEFIKDQGYDLPKLVADKTGYDVVPTHLPQVAQDFLLWVQEKTGVSPVNASIGLVSVSALTGMAAAYALYNRLSRECPPAIFAVIKDNEEWMKLYDALSPKIQAALLQATEKVLRDMFTNWSKKGIGNTSLTLGAQFAKAKEETQISSIESMLGKKLDTAKLDKDVKAAALKKVALVKQPGAQSDAASTTVPTTTAPKATWSFSDYIPSPINWAQRLWNQVPAIRSTTVAPVQTATTEVKETNKASI